MMRLWMTVVVAACFCLCATAREKPKTWLDEGPVEYLLPRHRMPLYESAFFSRHKTLPLVPHVNLLSPGALDEVFRTRSFKGEIIVSCFRNDDFSLRWMHHFARMAQSLGFDHVVPIGYDGATCEAFRRSWCGGVGCNDIEGAGYPGCAFLDPGAVEGADPRWQDAKRVDGIVYLWMVRYYVAAEALRRGINVLMSDTDVAVTSDFYATIKAPPLADHNMFIMNALPCPNGGLWYIQNAHPRGPLAHVLANAVHRMLAIAAVWRLEPPELSANLTSIRHVCSWEDQSALSEGLYRAAHGRASWEWVCLKSGEGVDERLWREVYGADVPVPQPTGTRPANGWPSLPFSDALEAKAWGGRCSGGPMALVTAPLGWEGLCEKNATGECARLKDFATFLGSCPRVLAVRPFRDLPLRSVAGDNGASAAAAARDSAAPGGNGDPREGPWSPKSPFAGAWAADVTETVVQGPRYVMGDFHGMWDGWDEGPPGRAYDVLVHLVAFVRTWGKAEQGDRNSREHLMQARGFWHGPVRAPPRALRLSPALVASAVGAGDDALRELVNALILLAGVTMRAPVLPAVECGALEAAGIVGPGLQGGRSRHGIDSPHWIPYRRASDGAVVCAPMLSSGHTCSSDRVLSDFHFDPQRFLVPHQSSATVTVPPQPEGAAAATRVVREFREGVLASHNGTHTLWLEAGDLQALLQVVRDPEGTAAALSGEEKRMLDELYVDCRDYRPQGLTREMLGYRARYRR